MRRGPLSPQPAERVQLSVNAKRRGAAGNPGESAGAIGVSIRMNLGLADNSEEFAPLHSEIGLHPATPQPLQLRTQFGSNKIRHEILRLDREIRACGAFCGFEDFTFRDFVSKSPRASARCRPQGPRRACSPAPRRFPSRRNVR